MTDVCKTTITLTVLHPADEPLSTDLAVLAEQMDSGNAVGWETGRIIVSVPAEDVRAELLALGNDGEFFAQDEEDNDE